MVFHSLHHSPYSFPHNGNNPLSQAAKLSDTNEIAITDAELTLGRSIKVEVFSVDSKNSHTMQLTVTYLYTGVHI